MGNFSTAVGVDRAAPLKARYMQIGNDTAETVGRIVAIGRGYSALRSDIAAAGDAEDIAVADAGFDATVEAAAQQFAALTDEERGWVDQMLAGLGYTRSE